MPIANALRCGDKFEPIFREEIHSIFPNLMRTANGRVIQHRPQPTDLPPVSDQLTDFGEPLHDRLKPDSKEEIKHCYRLVAVLWNSLRTPPGEAQDHLAELLLGIRTVYGDDFYNPMVRRNKAFEDDPRIVIEIKVIDHGNEYRMMVASVFPSENKGFFA